MKILHVVVVSVILAWFWLPFGVMALLVGTTLYFVQQRHSRRLDEAERRLARERESDR